MIRFISMTDWANVGYTLAESLKSIGVEAEALTRNAHRFEYPSQADVVSAEVLAKKASSANTVVFMHSHLTHFPSRGNQKLAVFHGGSVYRNDSKQVNDRFNSIVDFSLIQTPELLGRGAKNEIWTIPPIDTDLLQPVYQRHSPDLAIAHHPSGKKKGTEVIIASVVAVSGRNTFSISRESTLWNENMKRVAKCDIYIESLKDDAHKVWGISALEAAALGKVVVTNFKDEYSDHYTEKFGECPFVIANSGQQLTAVLEKLISLSDTKLMELRKRTREWAVRVHGFRAIGKRLSEILV